ncbi:MAG TPA: hypothetical protein VFM38_07015 [Candidatus Limnocylindrales bacterium]|nr:hypothetical protein [Candidatus Limnocylindrales bacterium]
MAIIGSLFAALGRFAGKLLNAVLGWATLLLFGKVSGSKQTILLLVALGSLVWVVTLLGIVIPDVGTFLLAFVPVPDFIDETWVRLAMVGLALVIPLVIGAAAIFLTEAEQRPTGSRLLVGLLRGYPFTLVLALTIVVLAGVALARKLRSLSKRWDDAHVPVIVKPGGYERVLDALEDVLDGAGLDVARKPAPAIVSMPPRLLDKVAGRSLGALVPDRLMLLAGPDLEVLVYPSDVAISGTKAAMARARAAIASRLTEAPAYMTMSAEAQHVEDLIRDAAGDADDRDPASLRARIARLRALDVVLARLAVPFDEWETVYRQRLQVERDLLARAMDELAVSGTQRRTSQEQQAPAVDRVVALGTAALIAVDALLQAAQLSRSRSRR